MGQCAIGQGAREERGFDAAGHLLRERRLQDYIDGSGAIACRWVETRYTYNAREQLVAIEQDHLSDPLQPGVAKPARVEVARMYYDQHGRLERVEARNTIDPSLSTLYRYDEMGRIVGVKVGEQAERTQAFDAKNRVTLKSDGDQATWRGRFDAWDRLYHERSPTGAFTLKHYDQANHIVRETAWSADPLLDDEAPLLRDTRSTFASFSEPIRVVEVLEEGENGQGRQIKVTERDFDAAGRMWKVVSGPPLGTNENVLDRAQARLEKEQRYEVDSGRLLEERFGGPIDGSAIAYKTVYSYHPDNQSPWADGIKVFERIPGQAELEETQSTTFRRDALGRVVEERRSDGSLIRTTFDRTANQPIQVRTGADAVTRMVYDGAGRQLAVLRANGRGATRYAYDLDGRLREQQTTNEAEEWRTRVSYDTTGRTIRVDYHDGSHEATTYNIDSTMATQTTRDGIKVSFSYDAANRQLSATPTLMGAQPPTLLALDAGDATSWDALSRVVAQSRASDAGLAISYPDYDLGSRPAQEVVGARDPLAWDYDLYSRPTATRLPAGVGRGAGSFEGFSRQFDQLDRMTDIGAEGGELSATPLGGSWTWGGRDRLWRFETKGAIQTTAQLSYLGLPGSSAEVPNGAKGKLGTLSWGSIAGQNDQIWGQFAYGWRGSEGDPRDGAKIGRLAQAGTGLDLFAGMGWSWDYDAGVRLSAAIPGRGSVSGNPAAEALGFRYVFGEGDELQRIVDDYAGKVDNVETGAYGRIASRDGVPFAYDAVGRRTEDDRFLYVWDWRGQLRQVTVKQGQASEGQQVRYAYDAQGRLHSRSHYGEVPAGGVEGDRPLIEKRAYVWEGQSLLAEAGYGDETQAQLRWRKTYVPGPTGLDDAIQVIVENIALPGTFPGPRTYTYLRDELGTVLGVVAEQETTDATNPVIPARYLYTPYGETYIARSPEAKRAHFDQTVVAAGGVEQTVADPATTAQGALVVTFGMALDASTLGGVTVDIDAGTGWQRLAASDVVVTLGDNAQLVVLAKTGWPRNAKARVQVAATLASTTGVTLAEPQIYEWRIPVAGESGVGYNQRYATVYESTRAAADSLGGRFPGGQNHLFQGLTTDPITGLSYARARWYDARNANWLSEDPMQEIDSPNLYAFVGWGPTMATDPLGRCGNKCAMTFFLAHNEGKIRQEIADHNKAIEEFPANVNNKIGTYGDVVAEHGDSPGSAAGFYTIQNLTPNSWGGVVVDIGMTVAGIKFFKWLPESSIGRWVNKTRLGKWVDDLQVDTPKPKGGRSGIDESAGGEFLDDAIRAELPLIAEAPKPRFQPPSIQVNRHGQLTNDLYTLDAAGMMPHKTGSLRAGKSQFLSTVDAEKAVLDAAAYADEAGLWDGSKAKVFVENGPIGVHGKTGTLTHWINIYRTKARLVHGAPGNPP
jgi:RHS repeat-associated protein